MNDITPPTTAKEPKAPKAPKTPKEPKAPKEPKRSSFATLYPEGSAVKVLAAANPKKEGSKSRERFEHYYTSKTVGDFLVKGGTYADIMYDVARKYIAIG